ncbi:MAG: GNAT family N-acetyltransferase [Cellulomonadaceae bacterium]|jgi:GNAT superfamily N-acetyltransferase|nr:GNAT family N-acetyltransferase [Cellulomonadaceae bacterium]
MTDDVTTATSALVAASAGAPSSTVGLVDDAHAGELLTLRRAAFVTEAQRFNDPHIAPLTQTLPELREDIAREDIVTLGAWWGSRLVGSVRIEIDGNKATLGRLVVAPDLQGQGIGTSLIFALVPYLPGSVEEVWVATGSDAPENLAFYADQGFEEQDAHAQDDLTSTYLRRVLREVAAQNG